MDPALWPPPSPLESRFSANAWVSAGPDTPALIGYAADGTLVPRSQPEAVLHDPIECVAQVARFFAAGGIVTADGTVLRPTNHLSVAS